MDAALVELLGRHGIDPATVIDATTEARCAYMWKTLADWPEGGTYEADEPRDPSDQIAGTKVTTTVRLDLVGTHPGARLLPVESGSVTRSRLEIVDEGAWVFST